MYRILIFLFLSVLSYFGVAQDVFQSNLYSAELIFDYKDEIKLTDEQAKEIKAIYAASNAEFMEMKLELRSMNKKMESILSQPNVDKDAAESQLSELLAYESLIKRLKMASLIDIKNTLTEEQQEILDQYNVGYDAFKESGILVGDGYEVKVRIRDSDDEFEKNQPLFVIQYMEEAHILVKSDLYEVDPNDIEAVEVIKGEKALDEYGPAGADGVVIVTLKSKRSFNRIKVKDE